MPPADATLEAPTTTPGTPLTRQRGAALIWALIACALLGASGMVRTVQESRHRFEKSQKELCPIDLSKLPNKIGDDWTLIKGGERKLDEYTMRITGGTDHAIRSYANRMTGVVVTLLLLYGPADPVLPHTPQVCYPASGFSAIDSPTARSITYSIGQDDQGRPVERQADFLMSSYIKPSGRMPLREVVYHAYRLDGLWSFAIGAGRKFPRRNPGLFKLQIQRVVAEGEKLDATDPIIQFLKPFLGEIEAEIKAAKDSGVTATKPAVAVE
jgi:hypothetical protein